MNAFFWIAVNALREAFGQNVLKIALGATLLLFVLALVLREITVGMPPARFILDVVQGGTVMAGSLLSVLLPAQMVFGEIESRTLLSVLSRPVPRTAFVLGKFAGTVLVIAAYALMSALMLGLVLHGAKLETAAESPAAFQNPARGYLTAQDIGLMAWFNTLRFCIVAAMTTWMSTFGRSFLVVVFSALGLLMIGQLQPFAQSASESTQGFASLLLQVIAHLSPNLPSFDLSPALAAHAFDSLQGTHARLTASDLWPLALSGLGWTALYLLLACISFQRREI